MSDEVAMKIIELLESIDGRLWSVDRHLGEISTAAADAPPPAIDPNQSYSREQAARLLRVSVWTIDRARKNGSLMEAPKIGARDVRITGQSIMELSQATDRCPVKVLKL